MLVQVGSRERSAEKLIKTLRELPNKEALALRSEVAIQVGCIVLLSAVCLDLPKHQKDVKVSVRVSRM